jgi:hypothetical protein
MFTDLRTKIFGMYQALHDASYPAVPVNYPNRTIVDPEQRTDPFVIANWLLSTRQKELGYRNLRVKGALHVSYYYRPNTGVIQSTQFTDFLLANIALKTINGVVFSEVTPYNAGMEGWEGTLNVIPFQIDYVSL